MLFVQIVAGAVLVVFGAVWLWRWMLACLPIGDGDLYKFERVIMDDNAYVLPCGGGVVYGHYQGLFAARLQYGSRQTARLAAHYLMKHGIVNTCDPETYYDVADTPQAYADIIFRETAGRATRRELESIRRRWAKGETPVYPEPSACAREVCDQLIAQLRRRASRTDQ